MNQKAKIQYVGQFYVYGSEARALEQERKKPKTRLPIAKLEAIEKIYIDPVALVGIAVAVVMLVVMVLGAVQIHNDWQVYQQMDDYVTTLRAKNAELTLNYRSSYDLADIEMKALAMGMVPLDQAERRDLTVTVPQVRDTVLTWDQKVVRFWNELWA
jgi:hypothetical protein